MRKYNGFLSAEDQKLFYTENNSPRWQRIEKRVFSFRNNESKLQFQKAPQPDTLFPGFFNSKVHFHCYCIEVKAEDGMSWAAEILKLKSEEEASKRHLPFDLFTLSPVNNSDPAIVKITGLNTLLSLAANNKLITKFHSFFHVSTLLVALASFVVPVIAGIVTNDLSQKGGLSNLFTFRYGLISVLTLFISLIAHRFLIQKKINPKPETVPDFLKELEIFSNKYLNGEDDIQNKSNYEKLINDVCDYLQSSVTRVIIVDDYQGVDTFSKLVIQKYFTTYKESRNYKLNQKECWVIFESNNADMFSLNAEKIHGVYSTGFEYITPLCMNSLTDPEKADFLKRNNMPVENRVFTNMKSICTSMRGINWVQTNLENYRKHSPSARDFGKLELIHLFALTSFPGKIGFSLHDFTTVFENGRIRSNLLRGFMYHNDFNPNTIKKLKQQLKDDSYLKDLVQIDKAGTSEEFFQLTYEATLVINKNSEYHKLYSDSQKIGSLVLPDEMLGHAFWATYWYDRLQSNHPNETFWFDKLSYHLTSFDFETIRRLLLPGLTKDHVNATLNYLLEAYIYTIGGTLRTAAFKTADELISCAVLAADELRRNSAESGTGASQTETKEFSQKLIRLYSKCCEAYFCLGSGGILKSLRRISDMYSQLSLNDDSESGHEEEAFVYSGLMAKGIAKEYLNGNVNTVLFSGKPQLKSLEDHIYLTAALFGSTLNPMVQIKSNLKIVSFNNNTLNRIDRIRERTRADILKSISVSYSITDLVNIPLLTWTDTMATIFNDKDDKAKRMMNIIRVNMDIVLHLVNEGYQKNRKVIKNEFFFSAVISDICSMTMASATAITAHINNKKQEDELKNVVNDFIKLLNKTIEINYEPLTDLPALLNDINFMRTLRLINATSALWSTLGFRPFSNNINLYGFYLHLLCYKKKVDTIKMLVESKKPIFQDPPDYLKLLTQLIIASTYNDIHSRYGYHIYKEAISDLENKPGYKHVFTELLLIKLTMNGRDDNDLSPYEKEILESQHVSDFIAGPYLNYMSEVELPVFSLRLLNGSGFSADLLEKIRQSIDKRIETVSLTYVKNQIRGITRILNYRKLDQEGKNTSLEEALAPWKDDTENDLYPFQLFLCLGKWGKNETLKKLVEDVFNSAEINDELNSHILLAVRYMKLFSDSSDPDDFKKIILYMENNIEGFERIESASENYYTYELLQRFGSSSEQEKYRIKRLEWDKIYQEEQRFKFSEYLNSNNYFLAFVSAVKNLYDYIDDEDNKLITEESASEDNPFVVLNGVKLLSAKFIKYGTLLFSDEKIGNTENNNLRMAYNKMAATSLNQVFEIMLSRNSSSYFTEITKNYKNVLNEYTMPENTDE